MSSTIGLYFLYALPLGVLLALAVTVWMFITARRERAGVPWLAIPMTLIVGSFVPIFGAAASAIIWKSQLDDRVNIRERRRIDHEASRIKPLGDGGYAGWMGRYPEEGGQSIIDTMTPGEHEQLMDNIINSILTLYPDHPQSRQIRANQQAARVSDAASGLSCGMGGCSRSANRSERRRDE